MREINDNKEKHDMDQTQKQIIYGSRRGFIVYTLSSTCSFNPRIYFILLNTDSALLYILSRSLVVIAGGDVNRDILGGDWNNL